MGGLVSTAAQVAAGALLPSLAALRAHHNAAALGDDAPGSRRASPAGAAAPSYTDVLDVLEILQQLHLPVELAIEILDAAFVPLPPFLLATLSVGNSAPEDHCAQGILSCHHCSMDRQQSRVRRPAR